MASVNWKKYSKGESKAMIRHDDNACRISTEKHTNPDLDKSRTYQNFQMSPKGWKGDYTYADKCKRLDERIAQLDANPNRKRYRKDRPEIVSLNVTVPSGIESKEGALKWMQATARIMRDKTGGVENFISGVMHFDEIHEYVESRTGEVKTIRPHLTYKAVAECNGILDAKSLVTREAMKEMNNAIEEMTQRDFGVRFMTGEARKGRSVEEMKNESVEALREQLEAVSLEREEMALEASKIDSKAREVDEGKKTLEAEKKTLEANKGALNVQKEKFEAEMLRRRKKIELDEEDARFQLEFNKAVFSNFTEQQKLLFKSKTIDQLREIQQRHDQNEERIKVAKSPSNYQDPENTGMEMD